MLFFQKKNFHFKCVQRRDRVLFVNKKERNICSHISFRLLAVSRSSFFRVNSFVIENCIRVRSILELTNIIFSFKKISLTFKKIDYIFRYYIRTDTVEINIFLLFYIFSLCVFLNCSYKLKCKLRIRITIKPYKKIVYINN